MIKISYTTHRRCTKRSRANVLAQCKVLFDSVAHNQGFHPFLDHNRWYGISLKDVQETRNSRATLFTSYKKAIVATYPNLCLGLNYFDKWKENVEQQRTFFTVLAHDKGFHATLEHDVWYSISLKDILYYKGGGYIAELHKKYYNAIASAFPELSLDINKLREYYAMKRKYFFDKLAFYKGFHPSDEPHRWYDITKADVRVFEGAEPNWCRSHRRAIMATYPDLLFDFEKIAYMRTCTI
jgi:hypothetical protein